MGMRIHSSTVDSGLVVVIFIISCLLVVTFSFLLLVDYEWCHVLYKNNTENPACTKNNNRDKLLLGGLGDQMDFKVKQKNDVANSKKKRVGGRRSFLFL